MRNGKRIVITVPDFISVAARHTIFSKYNRIHNDISHDTLHSIKNTNNIHISKNDTLKNDNGKNEKDVRNGKKRSVRNRRVSRRYCIDDVMRDTQRRLNSHNKNSHNSRNSTATQRRRNALSSTNANVKYKRSKNPSNGEEEESLGSFIVDDEDVSDHGSLDSDQDQDGDLEDLEGEDGMEEDEEYSISPFNPSKDTLFKSRRLLLKPRPHIHNQRLPLPDRPRPSVNVNSKKKTKKNVPARRFESMRIDQFDGFGHLHHLHMESGKGKLIKLLELDPDLVFSTSHKFPSGDENHGMSTVNAMMESIWVEFKGVHGIVSSEVVAKWSRSFAAYLQTRNNNSQISHLSSDDGEVEVVEGWLDRYDNLAKSGTAGLAYNARLLISIIWFLLVRLRLFRLQNHDLSNDAGGRCDGDGKWVDGWLEYIAEWVFGNAAWAQEGNSAVVPYTSTAYYIICSIMLFSRQSRGPNDGFLRISLYLIAHNECNSTSALDACWNLFRFAKSSQHLFLSANDELSILLSMLRKLHSINDVEVQYVNTWLRRIVDIRNESGIAAIPLEIMVVLRDILLHSTYYHDFSPHHFVSFEDGSRFSKILLDTPWSLSHTDHSLRDGVLKSMPSHIKLYFENYTMFFRLLADSYTLASDTALRKRLVSRMFMIPLPKVAIDVTAPLKQSDFCRIIYICLSACVFVHVDGEEVLKLDETSFMRLIDLNNTASVVPDWMNMLFVTAMVVCFKRLNESASLLSNDLFTITKCTVSSILTANSPATTDSRQLLQMLFTSITEIINHHDADMFWWLIDPGVCAILRCRSAGIAKVQQHYMQLVTGFTKVFWKRMKLLSTANNNGSALQIRSNISHLSNLMGSLEHFVMNQFSNVHDATMEQTAMESVYESIHTFVLINALMHSAKPFNLKLILDKYGLDPYWVTKSSLRYHPLHRMRVLAVFEACLIYHSFSRAEWQCFSDGLFSVWIRSFLDPLMQSREHGAECFKRSFARFNEGMFENEYFAVEFDGLSKQDNMFPEIMIHLSVKYDTEFHKPDARKSAIRSRYVGILTEILQMLGIGIAEAASDTALTLFYSNVVLDVMKHCSALVYHSSDHAPLIDVIDRDFMKNKELVKLRNYRNIRRTYFLCIGKYQIISDEMLRKKVTDLYLVLLESRRDSDKDLFLDLLLENSNFAMQTCQWIISAVIPQIYGKWYQEYEETKPTSANADMSRLLEPPRKCLNLLRDLLQKCISSEEVGDDGNLFICLESCLLDIFTFSKKPLKPHSDNALFQMDFIRFLETMAKFTKLHQRKPEVDANSIAFHRQLVEMQIFKSIEYTAKLIPGLKSLRNIVHSLERPVEWFIQDIAESHEHVIRERSFRGESVPDTMLKTEFEFELRNGKVQLHCRDAILNESEKKSFAKDYLARLNSFWKQTAQISPKLSELVAQIMCNIDGIVHDPSNDFGRFARKHGLFEVSNARQSLIDYDVL